MRTLLLVFLQIVLFSCSSVLIESSIAGSIIKDQLLTKEYDHLKNLDILLIEDADNGYQALNAYEFAHTFGNYKDSTKILDDVQKINLKERLKAKR